MKDLVKSTTVLGSTEILLILVAFFRNKYLAMTIGPEGFGLFSLLNSFFMMFAVFAGTWMTMGSTKYISQYYSEKKWNQLNQIISSSILIVISISVLISFLLIIWSEWFIDTFLSKNVDIKYYILFCFAFIGLSLRPVLLGILQGMRRISDAVSVRMIVTILNLLITVILVYFWKLNGFFVSIMINSFLAIAIFLKVIFKHNIVSIESFSLNDPIIRLLLSFGRVNLFLAAINLSSQYFQRSIILSNFDLASVGVFQAGVSIMGYLGILNKSASFSFLPKMSESMSISSRIRDINEFWRFILLLSIPISSMVVLFSKQIVLILYSDKFLILSPIIFLFVIAQVLNNLGMVFRNVLIGMAFLKIHTISSIVVHLCWVVVPLLFISKLGIASLGYGFLAGSTLGFFINWIFLRRKINLTISNNVSILMFLAVIVFAFTIIFRDSTLILKFIIILITIGTVAFSITKNEWYYIKNYLQLKFNKQNL